MTDQDRHFLTMMVENWLLVNHGFDQDESLQDILNQVIKKHGPTYIDQEFPIIVVGALEHLGLNIGRAPTLQERYEEVAKRWKKLCHDDLSRTHANYNPFSEQLWETLKDAMKALRDAEDEQVRVGTAALIFRDGHVLLGKRKGSHGAGTYSFPGGHVDFGEEPQDSVRREILEETGLEVGDIHPYGPLPYVNTHFHDAGTQYITLYYTVKYTGGAPKVMEPDKCEGWAWYPAQSLPQPLFEPISMGGIAEKLQGL